ncbi:hypothetical protein [Roseivirga sp. E12]|uniref:hypothetical protein n=1 Tax=Roseivirga sp. E12 TaxID=2819237 RepID=UPI001ABC4A14|nr:hypothetical protein [Roseivirga sp. E12]MBO3697723.1 hypothetical protein [Roseivirga sp. E12]
MKKNLNLQNGHAETAAIQHSKMKPRNNSVTSVAPSQNLNLRILKRNIGGVATVMELGTKTALNKR